MVKCCKYFYAKNKLLIVQYPQSNGDNNLIAGINDKDIRRIPDHFNHRMWITNSFSILEFYMPNLTSTLLSKTEFCDITWLSLNEQNITWNEFLLLTSSKKITNCNLSNVEINTDKNESAFFEDVIEQLPALKWFDFVRKNGDPCITSATVSKILKLPTFINLEKLYIKNLPEAFDLAGFKPFIDSYVKTTFVIGFIPSLSEDAVKRLSKLKKEMLPPGPRRLHIDF
uniref:Uncharacterized protein n=1 Tax=Panagrolaimus sp. ES5 TaxID=591445 RepID=A0AC34F9Y1_9BILA